MTLPNFLIVGAMRSGTTWLARCLGEHPEVFMAERKELHYFDRNHDRGRGWYEQQFNGANGAIAIGEATPRYMYDPGAMGSVADLLPNARLIVILRDPSDRAYSHYWLNRARRWESLPFEEAVEVEPDRIARSLDDRIRFSYVDRGRYAAQLKRIHECFEQSRVHIMLFHKLRADPEHEFSRVCAFLGVSADVSVPLLHARVNPYQQVRSVRARDATKWLPRNMPGRLMRSAIGRLNAKPASYPPMADAARSRIQSLVRDDIRALEVLLGEDLSGWAG